MAKRRKFSGQFKAKVALEALRDGETIQVNTWKRQTVRGMADVVARSGKTERLTGATGKFGPPEIANTDQGS
ncbi:hypothetical protein [Roseovarius sp. PS-C2]|uniref:hypothetical protein n=1 Tax=Roseovarius sp. PS-C2 TaxID=2820814 RepID=UPI001C0E0BCE|nr:hypothetical protein [Roseovarius sp. PS-C2]